MLCLLALVVVLVVWALNSGGGGGGKSSGAPGGSHTPAATITPGPAPSGTHISGRPGGRDTSGGDGSSSGGGTNGSGSGGSSGGTAGSEGTDAGAGTAGAAAGTGGGADTAGSGGSSDTGGSAGSAGSSGGGGSAGAGGASSTGGEVPVGSTLPNCAAGSVALTLTSVQNSYGPGETPQFRLKAANSSGVACKMDFGPRSAVFTVTKAADNSHVWASDDCPSTGARLMEVPAHGSTTFTLRWNGRNSSPHCAAPKGQAAQPGTYLVQAKAPGYDAKQASFVLSAD